MAQPKTKKPTGLSVVRNNGVFTLSWKRADVDYGDGQSFGYKVGTKKKWPKKYTYVQIGTTTTAKSIVLDPSDYYPFTKKGINLIRWAVRGNRRRYTQGNKTINPIASDWVYKDFVIERPNKPTGGVSFSDNYDNQSTFSWNVVNAPNSKKWFRCVEYQSQRVKESDTDDGSTLDWSGRDAIGWVESDKTNPPGATGSRTITEDSTSLALSSWTRWFRIRSQGPAGASEWRYLRHVYAKPYQAKITSAKARQEEAGGYLCTVKWASDGTEAHPIDFNTVEYAFVVPGPGMTCPSDAGWQVGSTSKDTEGADGASFSIDALLGSDECLFVRVNTQHDRNVTYGLPKFVDAGWLTIPSNVSVQTDPTTHRATIAADNESDVADSFLVVKYMSESDPEGFDIGIIEHGDTSTIVQCPDWGDQSIAFSVRAVVGSYTAIQRADGTTAYAVVETMASEPVMRGGSVPTAPRNISLSMTSIPGTIRVMWDWTWEEATGAELSWSDHEDAWESTEEPQTYIVSNMHASQWNISGLETGVTWYVRVRLMSGDEDTVSYSAYSDIASINLSSSPAVPVLSLSSSVITEAGEVTASWAYTTTDGTSQDHAEIREYSLTYELTEDTAINPNKTYYVLDLEHASFDVVTEPVAAELSTYYERHATYGAVLAHVQTAQRVTISAEEAGWSFGEEHRLAVRVVSESGMESEWSEAVSVRVAEPLSCSFSETSLVLQTITEDGQSRTIQSLREMPLTATVIGAGEGGITSLVIERAADYHVNRPDESDFYGYEGETVAILTQNGESQIVIDEDDLIGHLDDEAAYRLVGIVQDSFGQSAQYAVDFEVHWAHQAAIPQAEVEIDEEKAVAFLTPTAPSGAIETDVCDIYRLSADKPQLIYEGAIFGTEYVDPFPTIGQYGGYRFVLRTANGDYITPQNELAWVDVEEIFDVDYNIIDFDRGRVLLNYNVDVSNQWSKDFQETRYLGGSIQGDWNRAVERKSTVSAVTVPILDEGTVESVRRLAEHAGICHVRTRDGSSYSADVQVSEDYSHSTDFEVVSYSFTITKVDPEELDGMTRAEWERTQGD